MKMHRCRHSDPSKIKESRAKITYWQWNLIWFIVYKLTPYMVNNHYLITSSGIKSIMTSNSMKENSSISNRWTEASNDIKWCSLCHKSKSSDTPICWLQSNYTAKHKMMLAASHFHQYQFPVTPDTNWQRLKQLSLLMILLAPLKHPMGSQSPIEWIDAPP